MSKQAIPSGERLLRIGTVSNMTGLSRTTIYELVRRKKFPAPVRLPNIRRVAWRLSEVQQWIEAPA